MEDEAIQTLLGSGAQERREEEAIAADLPSDEQRLIDGLDQAALGFLRILLDDSKNEDGTFVVALDKRLDLFKIVRDWVAVRRRTDISDPNGDTSKVANMQRRLNTAQALPVIRGIVPPPPRKVGRPKKEEAAHREAYERAQIEDQITNGKHDDSALSTRLAMLHTKAGKGQSA